MEGLCLDQPRYCDKPSPFVFPLSPPEIDLRQLPGPSELRLREHHLRRPTATSYQERYMRLKPQDLTHAVVKRCPRRGLSAISSRGVGAFFFTPENSPDSPDARGHLPRSRKVQLVLHGFDIEYNLLEMKTGPCLALVAPLASGFLLITEIDAGCSFFVHALPGPRNR